MSQINSYIWKSFLVRSIAIGDKKLSRFWYKAIEVVLETMQGNPTSWLLETMQSNPTSWQFASDRCRAVVRPSSSSLSLGTQDPLLQPCTTSCAEIVDFEFAMADEARAQEMIHSWSPTQMLAVGILIGLDYLYMLLFGSYSSCWRNGRVLTKPWGTC